MKCEEEITVANPHGLHARPAALFVQIANKFDAKVMIKKEEEIVDGKSIIAILSLGVNPGTRIILITEGPEALEAIIELKRFLERKDD